MIKHEIIVHKETTEIVRNQQWPYAPHIQRNVNNQEELDALLEADGFSEGDFLVMQPNIVSELASIHRIVRLEKDFNKLRFNGSGKAIPYYVLKLANNRDTENIHWLRWEEAKPFRHPMAPERDNLILPNFDYILDYCKRKCEHRP